jgi:hypothetical protein
MIQGARTLHYWKRLVSPRLTGAAVLPNRILGIEATSPDPRLGPSLLSNLEDLRLFMLKEVS